MIFVIVQSILVAGLLAAFFSHRGDVLFAVPPAVWWAGAGLAGVSVVIVLLAGAALGAQTRLAPQPAPGATLIERGIYRRLRHPMYTSAILASAGFLLMRPTFAVAAFAAAVIVFYLIKARHEETILLAHFPGYAGYRARTRSVLFRRGPGSTTLT